MWSDEVWVCFWREIVCVYVETIKLKLETRLLGEISITSDMQMIPPLWQKAKKPLDESERGE